MSWRYVYISEADKINIHLENLSVVSEGKTFRIPLSDINMLLIEGYKATISSVALYKLMEYKVGVVICNKSMMPCGILLPFGQGYNHAKVAQIQSSISTDFKRTLWQAIIINKIKNQRETLEFLLGGSKFVESLREYECDVLLGDETNREGIAARAYFRCLFGKNFSRNDESNATNGYLNYGYAVVRGSVARAIASNGLNCSLGIFHKNEFNAYNLADDLIEIFRPIVDLYIYKCFNYNEFMTREDKLLIVNILNGTIQVDGRRITLGLAIEQYVSNIASAMQLEKIDNIKYPKVRSFIGDGYRIMRMIVMFDLPTLEPEDRKIYNEFRSNLLSEGFEMMQFSIYSKVCTNKDAVDKNVAIMQRIAPTRGSVRLLYLTEKQYSNMIILSGEKTNNETKVKDRRLIYF